MILVVHHIYQGTDRASIFAFFVLRQVSRRFRRLTQDREFLSHVFSNKDCCRVCSRPTALWRVCDDNPSPFRTFWGWISHSSSEERHCFGHKISREDSKGLGDLIRNENLCIACKEGLYARKRQGMSLSCKFAARNGRDWEFCEACKVKHPSSCFSAGQRVCIARTGYIRLCEHKVIYWNDFESLLRDPVPHGGATHRHVLTVCRHPSHRTPCSVGPYAAPIATIVRSKDRYYLSLNYDTFTKPNLAPKQSSHRYSKREGTLYLPFSTIKQAIQPVRQKCAQYFAPERISGLLPEMDCIYIDQSSSSSGLVRLLDPYYLSKEVRYHCTPGSVSSSIKSRPCPQRNHKRNNSCISLHYSRFIMLNMHPSRKLPRLNLPSHEWFHEIRRVSYLYKGPPCVAETCHDPRCRNYYSMTRTSSHPAVTLSRPPEWSISDWF
jgi:hypothetical protein